MDYLESLLYLLVLQCILIKYLYTSIFPGREKVKTGPLSVSLSTYIFLFLFPKFSAKN